MKLPRLQSAALATLAATFLLSAPAVRAADHGDAPLVRTDTRLDINDLYVFQAPTNPSNAVLIMTVSPVAGITGPANFRPASRYTLFIDNNADALPDVRFDVRFGKVQDDGIQTVKVFRIGANGADILARGAVGFATPVNGGGQFIAGNFDDPFFFDVIAFRNNFGFTNPGTNFFRKLNTLAIVLEVPRTSLQAPGNTNVGVWAATRKGRRQVDRMGRPAINTVLVRAARKDEFNAGEPVADASTFKADAIAILEAPPFNRTNADATTLANVLFPDILTVNLASTSGFLNGRKLADDVIDAELQLLLNNGAATDGVANDSTFSNAFPYLQARNP